MSPSSKPQGLRLYYSNDYLGSVGVHLLALVWNWLESLLGFIGLEAQTLTITLTLYLHSPYPVLAQPPTCADLHSLQPVQIFIASSSWSHASPFPSFPSPSSPHVPHSSLLILLLSSSPPCFILLPISCHAQHHLLQLLNQHNQLCNSFLQPCYSILAVIRKITNHFSNTLISLYQQKSRKQGKGHTSRSYASTSISCTLLFIYL